MTAKIVRNKNKGPGSDEPFEWTCRTVTDEKDEPIVLSVPSVSKLPKPNRFKFLRLQDEDPSGVKATRYILTNGLGPDTMEVLENMTDGEDAEFTDEWEAHSGTTLGKFAAS